MFESLLQRFLDRANHPVLVMDYATGRVLHGNKRAQELYGYGDEQWRELTFAGLFLPEDRPEFELALNEVSHRAIFAVTRVGIWRHVSKDGRPLAADIILSRYASPNADLLVAMLVDVSARRKLGPILSMHSRRLLLQRADTILEEERRRLSRDLHDGMGQGLTAAQFKLKALTRALAPRVEGEASDLLATHVAAVQTQLDTLLEDMHRIVRDLRPTLLDDFGLTAALDTLARDFQQTSGVRTEFVAVGDGDLADDARRIAVFRICQEALTNIAKHAGATHVRITLTIGEYAATLSIQDNGVGRHPPEFVRDGSLGVAGMHERAHLYGGRLDIAGRREGGTTVELIMPLRGMDTAEDQDGEGGGGQRGFAW